jgi:hypothetical protein
MQHGTSLITHHSKSVRVSLQVCPAFGRFRLLRYMMHNNSLLWSLQVVASRFFLAAYAVAKSSNMCRDSTRSDPLTASSVPSPTRAAGLQH